MITNSKVLKRSQDFFQKHLLEQRLKLTMKLQDELQFELDDLILLDIYVDKKEELHKRRVFTTYVHVFKLNDSTILNVDIFEEDAQIRDIAITNNYYYTYEEDNGGSLFQEGNSNDFGLCSLLEEMEYREFFLSEYDLLQEFSSSKHVLEAQNLFAEVQNSYPGLEDILYSGSDDDFIMKFHTGAEINVSKQQILNGHTLVLQKK
ncbi:hypothetical protein [Bacillus cereus group sp. TH152-1LC]|uniref:hypothetical protein n=1 Tax=Bacillus cereus group sp. TH152-1LC TaxID=3018060 RepID=UPI0022E452E7|nr:hypothetical protein [Bacillus cereus group sp. TH152-1LC]MDA1675045.1 hypothetical protein [Bacillus cereus group sp. TH152-1LC]